MEKFLLFPHNIMEKIVLCVFVCKRITGQGQQKFLIKRKAELMPVLIEMSNRIIKKKQDGS